MLNANMKEEKGRERSRREIKRGKAGVRGVGEGRQLHNRNYRGFCSVPLLSPDSTRGICFTNYMKNSDIGGQMSFLIVL